jgi:hypothetical protein
MQKNFAHLGGLNAYEILGVEQTATAEQIEAAYRSAIKRQHSDTGGVNRLAQLVNDARDALVKDRASYDAWLRNQPSQRSAEAAHDPEPAASPSDWSRFTWPRADDVPPDDPWDPWETVGTETPPQTRRDPRNQPGSTTTHADATTTHPDHGRTPLSAEERRSAHRAVLASLLCGPFGLWLGIRSYRRAKSAAAVVAIVIGGMTVLYIVSLVMAISLGVFREPFSASPSAPPTVMKQGEVVVKPGSRLALDESGTSFVASTDDASLVGTESGLLMEHGTTYVALAQQAPERYDTCSALNYPEPTDEPIPWSRLTAGSMLCVKTSYLETTKSLITVVDRSGRSATLKIITWDD